MTGKVSVAYLKSVKSSPIKVCRVSRSVKGLKVDEALKLLTFSKLKISPIISALIKSASTNAENNHNMDIDNLYVKEINVGKSLVMKRFHTRGRGKSSRILKTFSNIRVILSENDIDIKKPIPAKSAKKEIRVEQKK